ncbi:hypothetical protein [Citricoccus sp.]|uniref:hypothetical protein n=1 Tax=Citricoccus sp. TaxID=1978372 RepID=UPI0028BEC71E|nr:hypothetical protein [Citricoccus sp.]
MTRRGSHRPVRLLLVLVLLGALAAVLVVWGPSWSSRLTLEGVPWLGPECVVQTAGGEVGLDRGEAQRATTAAAIRGRGQEADTAGIDEAVLQRLAEGPPGDAGPSLSCRGSAASDLVEQQLTPTGLTPRAERLREAMADVFGDQDLGGFAPGGVNRAGESTHNDGRAIDVFFRPVTEENRRQGWLLAHWLVAHAEDLDVQYVIFDDRVWSARSAQGQWWDYDAPAPGNEILRHLDHVHVDVLRGNPG